MNTDGSKSDELARIATSTSLEDPPPAYEDISRPASILTNYTDATLTADAQPIPDRPFPLSFNLYYKKSKWKTMECFIGEHAEQPCNVIILKSGWKGTSLSLLEDEHPDSKSIAFATAGSALSRHSTITIPPLPDSDEEEIVEELHQHTSLKSMRFTFSMRIPVRGDKPQVEAFEWRITRGAEARNLDKHGLGWKLVRMDHDSGSATQGGKRKERTVGETSDGKEIVAVWVDNSKASRNKIAKFQFIGSGSTGELGRQWAIMAVTSILRICENVTMGATGGGAAEAACKSATAS